MKYLLLTDMPPCKNFTAGLVLEQLCQFLPKDALCCFSVVDTRLHAKISDELSPWVPTEYCHKPIEYSGKILPAYLGRVANVIGSVASLVVESFNHFVIEKMIVSKIVTFANQHHVQAVWCILEGQTMIRLALPVTHALNVPLFTQVWDPLGWWLRENRVNKVIANAALSEFDNVLRRSVSCAAASWAMAASYSESYRVKTTAVIPGLPSELAKQPAISLTPGNKLIIGMAGQIYASEEWAALIQALDKVHWIIGGRQVTIRFMGRYANLRAEGHMNIEYLGWRSQAETIELMSESDILYCPYWFSEEFRIETTLSFPSKLTTYLAAGRPVFFHGPAYASPAKFLEENNAGLCCYSLEDDAIISNLTKLIQDTEYYARLCKHGSIAFHKFLTLEVMRNSFNRFLDMKVETLLQPEIKGS